VNYIDFILLGGLGIGFILGFKDGIIRKLIGLIGFTAGIVAAFIWSDTLGEKLMGFFDNEINLSRVIAGILIFFVVLIIFSVIKRLAHPADKVNRFVNQFLGGIFGVVQMAYFLSGFLLFFHIFNLPPKNIADKSLSYNTVYKILPETIDFILGDKNATQDYLKEFLNSAQKETDLSE